MLDTVAIGMKVIYKPPYGICDNASHHFNMIRGLIYDYDECGIRIVVKSPLEFVGHNGKENFFHNSNWHHRCWLVSNNDLFEDKDGD